MSTVGELLRQATGRLHNAEAASEAQILLAHVLDKSRTWLFAWADQEVELEMANRYRDLIAQRASGTPVAYLVGTRDFWNLRLKVSPETLIPRPETELLVEKALQLGGNGSQLRVLDLGTGSGAIALALAHERRHWQVLAVERCLQALEIARANCAALGLENLELLHSDWYAKVQGKFDLILSNPPYICEEDPHLNQGDLRFEPREALSSGTDGLNDIRRIIAQAPDFLRPSGQLWIEHGFDQAAACQGLLLAAGFSEIRTQHDLAGHPRVTGGLLSG